MDNNFMYELSKYRIEKAKEDLETEDFIDAMEKYIEENNRL